MQPLPSVLLLLALCWAAASHAAATRLSGLAGLSTGGTYGLFEGLRGSVGERRRIRINSVLNAVGRRGPLWGNSLGCIGAWLLPSSCSQPCRMRVPPRLARAPEILVPSRLPQL